VSGFTLLAQQDLLAQREVLSGGPVRSQAEFVEAKFVESKAAFVEKRGFVESKAGFVEKRGFVERSASLSNRKQVRRLKSGIRRFRSGLRRKEGPLVEKVGVVHESITTLNVGIGISLTVRRTYNYRNGQLPKQATGLPLFSPKANLR